MAHSLKIILIIAAVLIILGVSLGAAVLIFGKGDQVWVEKSDTCPASVEVIRTDLNSGDVHLYQTTESEIQIRYYDCEKQYFTIQKTDTELSIRRKNESIFFFEFGFFNANFRKYDIEIGIPKNYTGDLVVMTNSGSITGENIAGAEVKFSVSSGNVHLSQISATENMTISASSGSLNLQNIKADGNLSANTTSGKIAMQETIVGKHLTASTNSGSLRLENVSAGNDFTASATSGKVLAKNLSCTGTLSASANSGSVSIESATADSMFFKSGSGSVDAFKLDGKKITIVTGSGSVEGSVVDGQNLYTIFSDTANGSNHLGSGEYGSEKRLEIRTTNGSIRFQFDDK